MAFKNTPEQDAALDTSKHISVQANAGSGKTKILVDRYYNLLTEKGIMPNEILAITFTKKASAEMKARIINKIEKTLTESIRTKNAVKASKLRKIREKLTKAKISTIDSFCSGILRDYPVEANVVPNFTKLDEIELLNLKDDAINDTLEDYMESSENKEINILDQFNINKLIENLSSVLDRPDALLNLENVYTSKSEYISKIKKDAFEYFLLPFFNKYFIKLKDAFEILDNIQGLKQKQAELINSLAASIDNIDSQQEKDFLSSLVNHIQLLKEDRIITVGGSISRSKLRNLQEVVLANELLSPFADKFIKMLEMYDYYHTDNAEVHYDYIYDFYTLAKSAYHKFNILKEAKNGVSFNDMIIKANDALNDENIKQQIAKKYKFVMVDEFQDTNQLQYDLIKNIIGVFSDLESIENNLFIVGDAKQSIYRFRNADVRVFEQAKKDIVQYNKIKSENIEGSPGDVSLTYTFRLFPVVADFINKVCEPVFNESSSKLVNNEYETEYDDLQFGKTDEIFENMLETGKSALDQRFGKIDYLFSIKEHEKQTDAEAEAEKIAEYINNIVYNEKYKIYDEEEQDFRKIEYSDITILSRKKSNFNEIRSAFLKHSIPLIVNSGTGFFNSPEIMDFSAFISFLYDNTDDISLAAILKAEFFAINDTELFKIASYSNPGDDEVRNTFWDKFSRYTKTEEASQLSKRAYDILTDIIPASRRIAISGLVDLITENTGWFAIIKNQNDAEQRIANVKKLKSYIISYENKGFKSLYDLVNELKLLSESSKEGEAAYIKEKNAVNLMTIHMSKGLEFNVVILYRLNSMSGGNSNTFDIDNDYGILFKLNNINETENTIISYFINQKINQADDAEEKRVLYVAMTRAKYRLCLSLYTDFKKDGSVAAQYGLAKLIYKAYDELNQNTSDSIGNFSQTMKMNINCLNQNISFDGYKYEIKAFETEEVHNQPEQKSEKRKSAKPLLLMNSIKRTHSKEIFSPTKIQNWNYEKQYPDTLSFTKRYLLGLKDDDSFYIQTREDEDAAFGADAGTVIHRVLEEMKEWVTPDGVIDNANLISLTKHYINELNISNSDLLRRVLSDIRSVISSDFIRTKLPEILNSRFEYNLSLAVGDDIINGIIDLLYIDKNANYEIWDWKSNYVRDGDDKDADITKLRDKYELQMNLYCFFIYKIAPRQKKYKAKLLLTREAEINADNENWLIKYKWDASELEIFGKNIKKVIEEIKENSLYSRYKNCNN